MDNEKNGNSEAPRRKVDRMRSRAKKTAPSGRQFANLKELRTPLRQAVGKRIEEAYRAVDLSTEEAAERIGVTYSTLRKYCRGDSEVDLETMQLIADLTRRPLHWFYGSGETLSQDDTAELTAYALFNFVKEMGTGKDPLEAFDRAIAPAKVSSAFRRVLEDHINEIRPRLKPWTDLPPEERRVLIQQLQELDATPPAPNGTG